MANTIDIQLVGIEPLVKKLMELGKLKSVKAALKAGASHIKAKASTYPPSTEANSPNGRERWYQRGYGPKWRVKSGAIHGRKTSETLGRRWSIKFQDNDLTAVVGNNASYVQYVHDDEEQASFHAARGWKTVQEIADQERATVQRFIEGYLQREINAGG